MKNNATIIALSGKGGVGKTSISAAIVKLLVDARYKIFDALVETDGFAFIAVGRPESAGCYCKINSYLKEVPVLRGKRNVRTGSDKTECLTP